MLKKTITYTDFNGEEASETFFFNMTKAELVELEYSMEGGFSDTITRMIETDPEGKVNGKVIMAEMKKLILNAYGVKSADGKRFIKNDQLRQDFESSEAYSVLFIDLVTDADAAAAFINSIIPPDLAEQAAKIIDPVKEETGQTPMGGVRPPEERENSPRVITRKELHELPSDEFQRVQAQLSTGEVVLAE